MGQPAHVVVIGAGLGGTRTVEQLRSAGYAGAISLIGAEPHQPYDRPPLSKQVLTDAWPPERIALRDTSALAVDTRFGVSAIALHEGAVELSDGATLTADAFVIATGVEPRKLPGQPADVHVLRTLDDALSLRPALQEAQSLLVVGGGFIGAEVASGARGLGLQVTVLEAQPVPCERALGAEAGALCARLIAESGVDLRLGAKLARFADARTVELAGGEQLSADILLTCVGAAPTLDWLAGSAADITNGIACDASGRVLGLPGVWAVGDVAAWQDPVRGRHFRHEHWTSVTDQATVVARDITGAEPPAPALPYFWSDQFGLKIQGLGYPDLADTVQPLHGDGLAGGAVKGTVAGYFANERLVGVVGFGAPKWVAKYRAALTRTMAA